MSAFRLPVDPCLCPLCGQTNRCAMASPETAAPGPCWCTRMHFSAELLQQVPLAARDKACICQACAALHTPKGEDA
ncbi:MAG: cysteine-rich CWC family protein [Limnohabitans sp.]|nr:cysteine-rich CWC family protein [Limnohabitans sp.]